MSKVVDISDAKLGFHDQLIRAIPRLRRFAQVLTGSSHDRDDLVQTSLERAMVKRQQWSQQRPLESWVMSIQHSIWKNELRSRSVRRGNGFSSVDTLIDQSSDAQQEVNQTLIAVREAVAKLPEAQRAVIMLVDVEGFSYVEAAEILDVPKGTLMSRLSRARGVLIEQMKQNKLSAGGQTDV